MRTAALTIVAILLAAAASAQTVICTKPDGTKYAGTNPPPDCKVERDFGDITGDASSSSWQPSEESTEPAEEGREVAAPPPPRIHAPRRRSSVGWFRMERSWIEYGFYHVLISYENTTSDTLDVVQFDCTAKDGSYPVGKGTGGFHAASRGPIVPGYRGTVEVLVDLSGERAGNATCEMYGW